MAEQRKSVINLYVSTHLISFVMLHQYYERCLSYARGSGYLLISSAFLSSCQSGRVQLAMSNEDDASQGGIVCDSDQEAMAHLPKLKKKAVACSMAAVEHINLKGEKERRLAQLEKLRIDILTNSQLSAYCKDFLDRETHYIDRYGQRHTSPSPNAQYDVCFEDLKRCKQEIQRLNQHIKTYEKSQRVIQSQSAKKLHHKRRCQALQREKEKLIKELAINRPRKIKEQVALRLLSAGKSIAIVERITGLTEAELKDMGSIDS